MTEVSGLDRRCGGQALEEYAAPVAAGASEPSAPKPTGPEPRPPSGGLVASVHHDGGLRLVDPPWPRDICPGSPKRRQRESRNEDRNEYRGGDRGDDRSGDKKGGKRRDRKKVNENRS